MVSGLCLGPRLDGSDLVQPEDRLCDHSRGGRDRGTPFDLLAYFYTKDLGRAFRVAEELEYGMVDINSAILGIEGVVEIK